MDRSYYRTRIINAFAFCLYAVTPAFADQQPVTNIAGPTATSTGSVTNQAVQVLNGPYMTNTYGGGVSCQGPSLNLTPFAYGSKQLPGDPTQYGSANANFGGAATISIPLSGDLSKLCKERAQAETDRQRAETAKARLDFELVRLLKCGEALKAGISFHPESPYAKICSDIIITGRNVR